MVGDPAHAKQAAVDALSARGFVLQWSDEWTALATRGSKVKGALLGAFALYTEVGLAIRSLDGPNSLIRIDSISSGWMGGVYGAHKTAKSFGELRDELGNTFARANVLVSHRDPGAFTVG